MKQTCIFFLLTALIACNMKKEQTVYRHTGSIERIDPELDSLIDADAKPEIIADGFEWSEGPVWVEASQMLLFSDVPRNMIYKWTVEKGKEKYLEPSGYTGTVSRGGEMGSNGLLLDPQGRLVLCQHGNRQMARMDAPLDKPKANFVALTNNFNGKRYNSPNDAAYNSKGELFFTDPPYGLEKQMDDTAKEIPFQGVYKFLTTGEVVLLADSLTRPNGIALMPGEEKILVANSDPNLPNWYIVDANPAQPPAAPVLFHSTVSADKNSKGLPDGFKFDKKGNLYATGPGGI